MRITKHTDYALRTLLFLAVRDDEHATSKDIADAHGISLHHLHKIVRELAELGLVHLQRGPGGGVQLAQAPEEISVGSVMRGLDDTDALIECFDKETNTCVIAPACGLKSALRDAQEAFYASLDQVTIAQIVGGRSRSRLRKLTGG